MCAVKIGVHGALRFTALPVLLSLHITLTLQQGDTSGLDRSRRDTKMRCDSLSLLSDGKITQGRVSTPYSPHPQREPGHTPSGIKLAAVTTIPQESRENA